MELDELKRAWTEHDRKLEVSIRLNTSMMRGSMLDKARTAMTRLSLLLGLELALILPVAVWLGSFMWQHTAEARFLIPAVTLHVCVIALVIVCVRQIAAISQVDYGAPVVAIQKRLEVLRVERIRATKWTLLLAPLAWTPMSIVALKSLIDVDVYAAFGTIWLGTNVLFGLVVLAVGALLSRRLADSVKRASLLQRLSRDIAGQNLSAAIDFLRSLAQFENEESGTA